MRIVGEITHPRLKITLMHHGRYLLKLEDVDAEMVYRFRDGEGVASIEDASRLLDLGLLQEAEQQLRAMREAKLRYARAARPPADDFPTIV